MSSNPSGAESLRCADGQMTNASDPIPVIALKYLI
jgi:hypothetical protein